MQEQMPYDIYKSQYPFWCFNIFFVIWCFGSLVDFLLGRTKAWGVAAKYESLSQDKQRNVVIYILQLVVTTVALSMQIAGGVDVFFQMKESTTESRFNLMLLSTQVIFILYIWELIYRLTIGFPLLIHHLMTCLIGQLFALSLFDTFSVHYVRLALIMLLYATTEQSSFVALLVYRLDLLSKKSQRNLFTLAAVQSFLFKSAIAIFAMVYFCVVFLAKGEADNQPTNWNWFWKIAFIPLLLMLFAAQIYSSSILWQLRRKCLQKELDCSRPSVDASTSDDSIEFMEV